MTTTTHQQAEHRDGLSDPNTKKGRVQRACLDLLSGPRHAGTGNLPTYTRFLFYELVQMGIVPEKAQGARRADQDVVDAVKHLRDVGLIPWHWIDDGTRALAEWESAETVAAFMNTLVDQARIDCWDGEPPPMILTESRAVAGTLHQTAYEYLCPIAGIGGQVGGFLHTAVAPKLVPGQRVLYLGDRDLAGRHIEANTRSVLERCVGPLDWERLALTEEQCRDHGIPSVIKTDRRYRDSRPMRHTRPRHSDRASSGRSCGTA